MGGNAFKNVLPHAQFPRLAPETYHALKGRVAARLRELYVHVDTPREAPEKTSYGDVDFVAYQPRRELSHDELQHALGAEASTTPQNNTTNNFAIRLQNSGDNDYYQIDIEVCATYEEYNQAVFWLSYGDMGMILGLMADRKSVV